MPVLKLSPPPHQRRSGRATKLDPHDRNVAVADKAVSLRAIDDLKPFNPNARTHTTQQLQLIAASIRAFGFLNPILIDETGTIIAGHGRVEAAKRIGLAEVPTVKIEHLTPEQKRAYVIADNRLAQLAGWNKAMLAIELQHLVEINFDVEVTGFSTAEIDLLIDPPPAISPTSPDDDLSTFSLEQPAVSRLGDMWELGAHRLLCGNALSATTYNELLGGRKAQMVFTDPPYNVPIDGHVGGLGRTKHREFVMATGELSPQQFTAFLGKTFRHLANNSVSGSIHYICMDWRHLGEVLAAARQPYGELKNICVWNKDNAGMGSFYRSKHEFVLVFKSGDGRHINNFGLGEHGRYRTNVWDYAGVNTFKRSRADELAMHPTVKPVGLVADAMRDCSKRNGLILDPFSGSGTTILAAERTGRNAAAMELDPLYVDLAIRRWEQRTGEEARHVKTGVSFSEISEERGVVSSTPVQKKRGQHA